MRALICSIGIALAIAAPAHADEDEREEARKAFAAGQAADRKKDYARAIEHYLRAYDLVPHEFAVFNIAVDYERLGKLREAALWYERYLDAAPGSIDRDKVSRTLIELRSRPGAVTIKSTPEGANVIIDGLPAGKTPLSTQLKGGRYRIVVDKDGQRQARDVVTEFGEPADVQFTLKAVVGPTPAPPTTLPAERKPLPAAGPTARPPVRDVPAPRARADGALDIRGAPVGAVVEIDGVPSGALPVKLAVAPGPHVVRVTSTGFVPYEATIEVTANTLVPVDANLARPLGSVPEREPFRAAYIFGGGGGVDLRGTGTMYVGEFGARIAHYDFGARIGRLPVDDTIVVDLLARFTFTKSRIAPYVGGAYSYVDSGFGYTFFGGLRLDVARGESVGISIMAESGFRYFSSSVSGSTGSTEPSTGSIVPLMATLLLVYGK